MALTDIAVRNAKAKDKPYKLNDSSGLYLYITVKNTKYWRLKYRYAGKEKLLSLGVYPIIGLSEARVKALEAKQQLTNNIDPSQFKKELKQKHLVEISNSFEVVANEWHHSRLEKWKPKHAVNILRRLKNDIFPALGHKSISEIKAPELLRVLRIIESRGAIDIAHRTLQICGQIFRYGIVTGRNDRDIAADLKGALKTRKQENYSRLEEQELPEFLEKLENYDGDLQTKLALKLTLLTFVRTGEARGARWEEFDFDKKEWRIPATRMKMGEAHIVPLSIQAITVLKDLQLITGNKEYLFPNRNRPITFISENTMLYALYRLGYHSRATVHGFRATASTILNENGFKPDVIERQLAHSERNKVRASYNHAQYLPERREMMQWWGNYLDICRFACNKLELCNG